MFLELLTVHALADYPLQGDFLSRAKSRVNPLPGVPWYQALGAHAAIHAGGVLLVTGDPLLFALEFIAHALIDDAKCRGRISFNVDQAAHVACKMVWCLVGASQ